MKYFCLFCFMLPCFVLVFAQHEELNDLDFNPALYYSTKKFQNSGNGQRYLVDAGITIVSTDTLKLPFVDDFSKNTLRGYKWLENNITATYTNVFGTCLGTEGVKTIKDTFSTAQAWDYTFDTNNIRIDSVAQAPIMFTFFGPAPSGCFAQTPQTFTYWNQYYTYTFDTATGTKRDSTLVTLNTTTVDYAPVVYFAAAEPGKLWFDNYAYHNYTYPVNPPTIGVATLDGLNEYGLPYNNSSTTTYGTADYLTSLPIDMSALSSDSNVYLSFFYEAAGLGDYPDKDDSLLLEFKDNAGVWRMVWSDTGYSHISFVPQKFKQVLVQVPSLSFPLTYFHNTFQFRFRNKASLYGNNDHWHIDYVKLDKNRSFADTIIQEIAFVYPFPTILKNFTQMPADQFNHSSDLRDSFLLTVHNLDPNADNNPPATNFTKSAMELYPGSSSVAADVLQTFNAGSYSFIQVNPSADYSVPSGPFDSLVIRSKVFIDPFDSRPQNDTLYHVQNFNSVMAYDDGTAEKSYGIVGLGLKKFAYEFNLNQPDTLSAFQIHFAQVDDNVSNLVFSFYAWDSLRLSDLSFVDDSQVIYSLVNRTPFYVDSVSGFATYKLDSPIIISGKIYFGWSQTDDRRLQIGYDLNSTLGKPHMFYFSNATWKASTIIPAGSPMIRLIFDTDFWGGSSSGIDLIKQEDALSIFPNPTSGVINFKATDNGSSFEVLLTNMLGQIVKYEDEVTGQMNISNLQNGIYLLSARDKRTGRNHRNRIIKTDY